MRIRKKVCFVLMLVWMCVIFTFSARPGTLSEKDSGRAGLILGQIFIPDFEEWSREEQEAFAEQADYPVRKTAHAAEYALLGLLVAGAYVDREMKFRRRVLVPWGAASLYAATDEIHQLFVPGRSGQLSDVLLDSAGVLLGVILFALICRMTGYFRKRRTYKIVQNEPK